MSITLHILQDCSQRRRLMGTDVLIQLTVLPAQLPEAHAALKRSFLWLSEVEQRLTRFNPESELMQLNGEAGVPCSVSPMLLGCLVAALQAAEYTQGLFDPTLLPHVQAAGYDRDFAEIAHRDLGPLPRTQAPTGRWREIQVDIEHSTVVVPKGVGLDLGGIAKGWAADQLVEQHLANFPNVLVDVGGDIRLRGGPSPETDWAIALDNPRQLDPTVAEHLAIFTVGNGGIATSGANRRWWKSSDEIKHHLIDPRSGQPALLWTPGVAGDKSHLLASATACAETAVEAEVMAKAALLRGLPDAPCSIESEKVNSANDHTVLLVSGDGQLHISNNFSVWLGQHSKQKGFWLV